MRKSGRLLIGGVVTEISHALGTVVDSRGRERDAYMVEEGTSEVYAVFSMPEQAAEAVEAIVAIGRGANLLDYKWEGLESTEGKGDFGPFCARTNRRISAKFHDGGDIKVIKLTRDGDPDVEFEAPDGTREPIDTEQAISVLRTIAAESGGKGSKKPAETAKRVGPRALAGRSASKAAKKLARPKGEKAAKKVARATKKTSKKSSKKAARATKRTSKKRSPRR